MLGYYPGAKTICLDQEGKMEKKAAGRQGIEQVAVHMVKAILCAYIVT